MQGGRPFSKEMRSGVTGTGDVRHIPQEVRQEQRTTRLKFCEDPPIVKLLQPLKRKNYITSIPFKLNLGEIEISRTSKSLDSHFRFRTKWISGLEAVHPSSHYQTRGVPKHTTSSRIPIFKSSIKIHFNNAISRGVAMNPGKGKFAAFFSTAIEHSQHANVSLHSHSPIDSLPAKKDNLTLSISCCETTK